MVPPSERLPGGSLASHGVYRESELDGVKRRRYFQAAPVERPARVAALFYTLFESAKLAGVDPHRYVLDATRRAMVSPGTGTLPEASLRR